MSAEYYSSLNSYFLSGLIATADGHQLLIVGYLRAAPVLDLVYTAGLLLLLLLDNNYS